MSTSSNPGRKGGTEKQSKTLVLGLGNDLYGDDGVGIHVIEQIKNDPACGSRFTDCLAGVDLLACGLTGLSILDIIIGYDRLIIIDTIKKEDPETGRISVLDAGQIRFIPGPSPHYVSIPQTIEIGRKIGLKVPDCIQIIAVEAKNLYRLGEGLSPEMKAAVPDILGTLKTLLKERG